MEAIDDLEAINTGKITGRGTIKCFTCKHRVHREYDDLRAHARWYCKDNRVDAFDAARREILEPYGERDLNPGLDMDLRIAKEFLEYDDAKIVYDSDSNILIALVTREAHGLRNVRLDISGLSTTANGMFRIMCALECKGLAFEIGHNRASITKTQHDGGDRIVGHWSYPAIDGKYPEALAYCVIAMLDKREN